MCKGGYYKLGARGKLSDRRPHILHVLYKNFIRWKQVKFFNMSGNLLLRESPFYIVNCLKSFDFKYLFVYTLKVVGGALLAHLHKNFFILTNI